MTASQRRQMQSIEDVLGAMVGELEPRVIVPSAEKQLALGIAEETMLIPVGSTRAVTVCASPQGGWSITEFDTSGGELKSIWQENGDLTTELVVAAVLGAVVGSLQEQVELGADPHLAAQLQLLRARHDKLIEDGIGGFEFESTMEPEQTLEAG